MGVKVGDIITAGQGPFVRSKEPGWKSARLRVDDKLLVLRCHRLTKGGSRDRRCKPVLVEVEDVAGLEPALEVQR